MLSGCERPDADKQTKDGQEAMETTDRQAEMNLESYRYIVS